MNDFCELENELRNLRPARPSPILFERVEEAMAGCRTSAVAPTKWNWRRFTETPYSLGIGLAAAAVLVLFAAISIPAGVTQVVYNTRDEGLQFARGSEQPLRRLRYQMHQTWQWRNPTTGASLRVSYPSEEVVLIPVSGQ